MSGALNVGGSKVTGLAAGSDPADAVRYDQVPTLAATPSGDLGGTYAAPTVRALSGQPLSGQAPGANDVLTWNGSAWAPAQPTAAETPSSLVLTDSLRVGGRTTLMGDIIASGTTAFSAPIRVEGAGTRMMWIPEYAAFRAGHVNGTQWHAANTGMYSVAMGHDARASADNAIAMGLRSTAAQVSSVALGEDVTASGAASVALGYHAHTNARQGSFVFGDRSTVDTIRAGVNHSANWRVSGGFRVFTSSNLSTGVTIQSGASVSNWGQSSAVISTSTGAYLSTGGAWINASDSTRKRAFALVDGEDVLRRLAAVPLYTWQYNAESADVRHMGPTAQAFRKAFGLGQSDKAITTVDADGVALAGVQALEKRTAEQAAEIESLKRQVRDLQQAVEALVRAAEAQRERDR